LSNNELLNKSAKRWGLRFGADQFVAGTDMESVFGAVKDLNEKGISCTIDNLGEFVTEPSVSIAAKNKILRLIERINEEDVDCHLSVKLTQLGLFIEQDFCLMNMREIVKKAAAHNIFVNIDTEDYAHYEQTLEIVTALKKEFHNIGFVIQSYLFRAEEDMDNFSDLRLRIVKGAYKES